MEVKVMFVAGHDPRRSVLPRLRKGSGIGGSYARERDPMWQPRRNREMIVTALEEKPILTGYPLPDVPFLRLRFALESQDDAWLPPYKGSLLRGAFGHALRRAVCSMGPRQPCETCSLNRACVYTRLFEALAWPEPPPYLHGQPAAPRPFVSSRSTSAATSPPVTTCNSTFSSSARR